MIEVLTLGVSLVTLAVLTLTGLYLRAQTRIAQYQAARSHQLALIELALHRPELRTVFGDFQESDDEWRIRAYRNLWFMQYQMTYLTGEATETMVRNTMRNRLFQADAGREWWRWARDFYETDAGNSRALRRYFKIVDSEYENLVRSNNTYESAQAE